MKLTNSAIIIAIGFLTLYLTLTGKIDIFAAAFRQAFLGQGAPPKTGAAANSLPALPTVPGTNIPQPYRMPQFNIPRRPSY